MRINWRACFWMAMLTAVIVGIGCLPTPADASVPRCSQAATKTAIRCEAKRAHLGKADTAALLKLAYRESRWHAASNNHGRYLGVFQLSRSMCRGKPWWNPRWNTRRALAYIRHRYGTPARALAFWHKHRWY
jgi:hypothetical protein